MRRLLVDGDGTTEDVVAVWMAAKQPDVEVVAVTTVAGCVRVSQATDNVLYGLELAGISRLPVYAGCERPLVRPHSPFDGFFGRGGLGAHSPAKPKGRPESAHAVDAILSLCRHYRKELELVCLGPLTNLAAALIQAPRLAEMPAQVYVYGGSAQGGNVTACAEYNFYADPEAASLVLDSGLPVTLFGWDLARQHLWMRDVDIHRIRQGGTKECRFFLEGTRTLADYARRMLRQRGSDLGAVLATAAALDPAVVRDAQRVRADVETRGELTRGQLVLDLLGLSRRPPNVRWVRDVDGERARELLFAALGAPPVAEAEPGPTTEEPEAEPGLQDVQAP
ncbi:MAG: nucleoside hydrolase [Armatimonadota bacterium]|nr:nucleoside hydrolase [Armatimonadota bacterium]MDW8155357.1 nucleoside hydrolase [Armatimonadota bacterium]